MTCRLDKSAGTVRIDLDQVLDMRSVAALANEIATMNTDVDTMTIDLSSVTRLDGAGIGAVAHLYRRAAASGRRVRVTGAHGQPLAYMQEIGLARTLGLPRAARAAAKTRRPAVFGLAPAA